MVVDVAEDSFGHLDIVLLNAASPRASPASRTSTSPTTGGSWRQRRTCVYGVCAAVARAAPGRRRPIVATASLAGLVPMPGDPLYTLTKHAVVGYVRAAAPAGVRGRDSGQRRLSRFADRKTADRGGPRPVGDFPLLTAEAGCTRSRRSRPGEPGSAGSCSPAASPPRTGSAACRVRGPDAAAPRVVAGPLIGLAAYTESSVSMRELRRRRSHTCAPRPGRAAPGTAPSRRTRPGSSFAPRGPPGHVPVTGPGGTPTPRRPRLPRSCRSAAALHRLTSRQLDVCSSPR